MTQDDAFLQAIIENPDDDTPRLVYADWLEEHGDPDRAEFIRVQIEMGRGVADPETGHRLRQREVCLLREHELRWTTPLHGLVQRARFVRGFPERVTLLAEGFLRHAGAVFRLAPVRHLILTEAAGHLPRVADSPYLERVQALEFRTFAGQDLRTLARSPHLGRLTRLILRYAGLEDEDAAALAATPSLAGLTALDLYGCILGPVGIQAIATSVHLARLTELALGDHEGIGDAGAEALASANTRLSRLHLSFAGISDAGARALAASPALAVLQGLDLGYNAIGAAGARALAGSPHLQALTHLSLRGNPIGRGARQTLAARLGGRIRF
jgi:uncharacterized protein (TIGR02996 family)